MIDTCVCCGSYVPEGRMICPGCEYTNKELHLKDKKTSILEYLEKYHRGKENAVHSKELERLFSLDGRGVRRKISSLRKDGYPICSGDVGYYYANNRQEINSTLDRLDDLMVGVSDTRRGLLVSAVTQPVMTIRVTIKMKGGDKK